MGGKNSAGGPKWVVKQDRLLDAINCEKQLQTRMLMLIEREKIENGVDQNLHLEQAKLAIQSWFRMYHSVVLLVAARNKVDIHPVNIPEEGFIPCPSGVIGKYCLEDSYMLPAFGLEEDDDFSLSGLKFDQMIKKFSNDYRDGSLGQDFVNLSLLSQPVFGDCLNKYKSTPLTPNKVLEACKSSTSGKTSSYGELALGLIGELWGEKIADHLEVVNTWQDGSQEWWKTQIGIDADLEDKVGDLFYNGNSDVQQQIGQIAAVTSFCGAIYTYVYNRFVYKDDADYPEVSHGLEGVVNKYTVFDQQAWEGLLSISYGAVAWQIFDQVKLAVDRVHSILKQE